MQFMQWGPSRATLISADFLCVTGSGAKNWFIVIRNLCSTTCKLWYQLSETRGHYQLYAHPEVAENSTDSDAQTTPPVFNACGVATPIGGCTQHVIFGLALYPTLLAGYQVLPATR